MATIHRFNAPLGDPSVEQAALIALAYSTFLATVAVFIYGSWYNEHAKPADRNSTLWQQILPPRYQSPLPRSVI